MARISHAGAALSIAISLLLFALVSHAAVIAGHANVPAKRHTVPAQLNIANATEHELTKRYTVNKSKWTYYETGKGACGGTNKDSDWIVAIDSGRFDSSNWCWKTIELFYNGKSAKAQVVDRCPGCGDGNLDLSPGLFQYFDSLDKGVLYGAYNA